MCTIERLRRLPVLLLTLLLIASTTGCMHAMHGGGGMMRGSGRLAFGIGARPLDLDELNDHLVATGYPELSETMVAISGGFLWQRDRLLLGLEGAGVAGQKETSGDRLHDARLEGGFGAVDIGYAIVNTPRFTLYPMLGLGGGAFTLDVGRPAPEEFDDVLTTPTRSRPYLPQLVADVSLNADYRVTMRRTERHTAGLLLGLRGGYTFATQAGDWRLQGERLDNGPDLDFSGPYGQLRIGFWGTPGAGSGERPRRPERPRRRP